MAAALTRGVQVTDDSDDAKKKFTFDYSYWSFNDSDSHFANQVRCAHDPSP